MRTLTTMMDAAAHPLSAGIAALPSAGGAATALVLAGGTLWLMWVLRRLLVGTTLMGPWRFCLAATVGMGLVAVVQEVSGAANEPSWLTTAQFVVGVLALCPAVSVLGAKRPQERAWNFVVLALWGIVSLPSLALWMLGRGHDLKLFDLRGIVLWALLVLPAINYLPTRFALSALLFVAGELIWLGPQVPLIGERLSWGHSGLLSLVCFLAAALWTRLQIDDRSSRQHRLDRAWLAFRNRYGLFWGLRLQERLNAASRQHGWSLYLSWSGFRRSEDHGLLDGLAPVQYQGIEQALRGLLLRFADSERIATWMSSGVD